MPGRIITLQRQARELGRLRTGLTDDSGSRPRPVRSQTWIVSSHAEHYVEAAAAEWGGQVEKWQPQGNGAAQFRVITETPVLDAILPPGDPLSQTYETWSRGGCQRRCDGITEQLSDSPCLCVAEFGDNWFEQEKGKVCSAHTRLNVILPQMPDIGVWRMETGSFYAANEIAAHVDLIRNATHGEIAVPIRMRIEQRTRVANGKTKQFPVVAVELRGATAGQIMAGTANLNALDAGKQHRAAIEAGNGTPDVARFLQLVKDATTRDELLGIRESSREAGIQPGTEAAKALDDAMAARNQQLTAAATDGDEDTKEIRDQLYAQIVAASRFDSTGELHADFADKTGKAMADADAAALRSYIGGA